MGSGCSKSAAGEPSRPRDVPFASAGLQPKLAPQPPTTTVAAASRRRGAPGSGAGAAVPSPQQHHHSSVSSLPHSARGNGRRQSSLASGVSAASGGAAGGARKTSDCCSSPLAGPLATPLEQQQLCPSPQQQQQLPAGFSLSTGQPPHHMLSEELTRISCGLLFHVRVYGMKARGLSVSSSSRQTCLRLEWAAALPDSKLREIGWKRKHQQQQQKGLKEREGLVLMTEPAKGRSPRWFEAFEFTWRVASVEQLHQLFLLFSVVEALEGRDSSKPAAAAVAAKGGPTVVGSGSVSLFAVATGPVHHDVLLKDTEDSSQTGRLIMDVRMQQICDLVINPIEVLAHLSDSASSSDSEDDGDTSETAAAEQLEDEQRHSNGSFLSAEATADSAPKSAALHSLKSSRRSAKSDVFCRARCLHPHSFASRSHNFRCGERQRRQAAAAAARAAKAARAAAAAAPEDESAAGPGGAPAGAGDCGADEFGDGAASSPRELEEEEPEPLSAHWVLSFCPTGVDNPREAFSIETENVQQPYWNAVDHALLVSRLRNSATSASSVMTAPCMGSAPQDESPRADSSLVMGAITPSLSMVSVPEGTRGLDAAERQDPFTSMPAAEAGYRLALDKMAGDGGGETEIADAGHGVGRGDRLSDAAYSWRALSQQITRRQTQRHLGHLDVKSTYQKLAAVAARGELVREVLHDTFPTLQLSTTIDQLRQHYLRIRLHAKVFPNDSPTLFGECWLPFFKVYDAEVVTSVPRQFYDSYFREKLWLDGKHVGVLEGVIVFQNNPVVRQVCAGVQTEKGLCRIFPPVLGHEHRPVCFKFTGAANSVPRSVARIAELHEKLLHLITRKTLQKEAAPTPAAPVASAVTAILTSVRKTSDHDRGGVKTLEEAKAACDELLQLLNASDVDSRRSFLFASEAELLRSQRVLLNLANHTLEFLEYVFWQCRASYCAVLCAILRRGELDLGTVLPSRPDSFAALTLSEVYVLYSFLKAENAEAAAAAAAASGVQGGDPKHKLFVSQRSVEFDDSTSAGASCTSGSPSKPAATQHHGHRLCIGNALLPRLGGGEGEGHRTYLGAALHKLKNSGIAVVPAGDAEAAAQLGRELRAPKVDAGGAGADEVAVWKAQHLAAVSKERTEQLKNFAKSLSSEARVNTLLYHKRLKLCRQFRLLLHRALAAALRMLGGEASFGGQRRFACMLLAATYFRLPDFRNELLKSVLSAEGRSTAVDEWRGTEYLLDAASLEAAERWAASSPLRVVLQWEVFHSTLKDYFGDATLKEDIDAMQGKLSPEPDWRKEVSPAGTSFFAFLEQWVRAVLHSAPPRIVLDWRDLPGYPTLLKRLLLELKARSVTKFPDSLVNCTGAMLANEKLLSVFVKIVFLRTNAHSSPQVFSALTYVDFWAQLLASRGRQLPPNFDFAFLRKGLQLIIESDLYANVSKCLWFVYRNLPILNGEQLEEVLISLCLQRHGVRLFMHWAWIVRRAFMWVLLYRLVEGMRRVIGRITGIEPSFSEQAPQQQLGQAGLQQRSQQEGGAGSPARRVALSAEESVVIKGHSVLVAFLRALSVEEILPADAVRQVEAAEAKVCSKSAASGPGRVTQPGKDAVNDAAASQQLFEGDVSAPELQVYRRQAVAEFRNEVDAYKNWVAEGAASLPMMVIPSAPLDANTDVPLEGWQ